MSSALVIVDVQKTWSDNNPLTAERILAASRALRDTMPIIWIYMKKNTECVEVHPAKRARVRELFNSLQSQYKPTYQPDSRDFMLAKPESNGFAGTELEAFLKGRSIKNLFFAGFLSSHCVMATASNGAQLGFNSTIITDLTSDYEDKGPLFCQFPAFETSLHKRNAAGWISLKTSRDMGLNLT